MPIKIRIVRKGIHVMEIDTDLSVEHSALVSLFMEANELNFEVGAYTQTEDGQTHQCIRLSTSDTDAESKIIMMGIRHSGVKNMLDHYLLRCAVPVEQLHPRYKGHCGSMDFNTPYL